MGLDDFIRSATSVVTNVLSIGLSVSSKIASALSGVGLVLEGLKLLGRIFVSLAQSLGFINQDLSPEELGDKALQAEEDGISPEQFSTYEEYVKKVESFETDPNKSLTISTEDKLKKAVELSGGICAEKLPESPFEKIATLLIKSATEENLNNFSKLSEFLKPDRMQLILGQPNTALSMLNYLLGTERNVTQNSLAVDALKKIEQKLDPNISEQDAMANIREARLR